MYSDAVLVAARADHTNADCFVCCVLSHGDEGVIYGCDGTLKVDDLIANFKPNALATSLAGKPKIFFIQVKPATPLNITRHSRSLRTYFFTYSVIHEVLCSTLKLNEFSIHYQETIWDLSVYAVFIFLYCVL